MTTGRPVAPNGGAMRGSDARLGGWHRMRTFWMQLFAVANAALLGVFVYFFVVFVLPSASKPEAAAFVPIFVIFMALFGAIVPAAWFWRGARQRAWFWALAALPALVVLLLFSANILYDLAHPTVAVTFVSTLLALFAALLAMASGIIAFRGVRAERRPMSGGATTATMAVQPSVRTRLVLGGLFGAVMGACLTSLAAGAAASAGGGVAEAPTTTATIQAKDTRFVEQSFSIGSGDVMGIFLINRDSVGHAFDIDSLNVHVALPPNSTTAVAIKPPGAGRLEFYCSIPGHRQSGMVGTIEVR